MKKFNFDFSIFFIMIFITAGCSSGFESALDSLHDLDSSTQTSAKNPFSCNPNLVMSSGGFKRLTKSEYTNTLNDLIPREIVANLLVQRSLDQVREENDSLAYDSFASEISRGLIEGHMGVAEAVAEVATSSSSLRVSLLGNCASSDDFSDSCVEEFLVGFAPRVLRSPISTEDLDSYLSLYQSLKNIGEAKEALQGLITSLLLAPQFLYKIESEGTVSTSDPNLIEISSYELASRLSYFLWGSMPDKELFAAAADGSLKNREGYKTQVDRMLANEKVKDRFKEFYSKWLRLSKIPSLSGLSTEFRSDINASASLRSEMIDEIHNLVEDVVWNNKGGFEELFTTTKIYSSSPDLAKIYGLDLANPESANFKDNERAGLLNRAALLVTGTDETSPFKRGNRILEDVLCRELPRPETLNIDPLLLEEPPPEDNLSTRERFHQRTSSQSCMSCHSQINPLGFGLGHFDGLGRYSEFDRVFIDGEIVGTHPVDAHSEIEFRGAAESETFSNGADMSRKIASSAEAKGCFTKQWYRFSFGLRESESLDGCDLNYLYKGLTQSGGSIQNMIKITVFSKRFLTRVNPDR